MFIFSGKSVLKCGHKALVVPAYRDVHTFTPTARTTVLAGVFMQKCAHRIEVLFICIFCRTTLWTHFCTGFYLPFFDYFIPFFIFVSYWFSGWCAQLFARKRCGGFLHQIPPSFACETAISWHFLLLANLGFHKHFVFYVSSFACSFS